MKITLSNISKNYNSAYQDSLHVLDDINLTIADGSFVVILGESGCGKSTMLNLIAGLAPPNSGSIIANDTEITSPSPDRTIIFQQPSLLPWLTSSENITFGCRLRGDRDNLKERAAELINMTGLSGFEDAHPSELSVGMAQRVSLARALIGRPKVLLLDEPFGALDTLNRTHLQEELITYWQKHRNTMVLVTHDIDEALAVGEKIVFLGGSPCTIQAEHSIDFAYPRDILSPAFFEAKGKVLTEMRKISTMVNKL